MWEGLALWRASSWSNAFGLGFVEGWSQTNDVRRRLQGSRTFKGCASQGFYGVFRNMLLLMYGCI